MLPAPFLELLRFISPVIIVLHLSKIFFWCFLASDSSSSSSESETEKKTKPRTDDVTMKSSKTLDTVTQAEVDSSKQPEVDSPKLPEVRLDEEEAEQSAVVILSEDELNKLASKVLRAEMMGDAEKAEKLKTQLESARKIREEAPDAVKRAVAAGARKQRPEAVLLTRTNDKGMVRPLVGEEQRYADRKTRQKQQKNAMVQCQNKTKQVMKNLNPTCFSSV